MTLRRLWDNFEMTLRQLWRLWPKDHLDSRTSVETVASIGLNILTVLIFSKFDIPVLNYYFYVRNRNGQDMVKEKNSIVTHFTFYRIFALNCPRVELFGKSANHLYKCRLNRKTFHSSHLVFPNLSVIPLFFMWSPRLFFRLYCCKVLFPQKIWKKHFHI